MSLPRGDAAEDNSLRDRRLGLSPSILMSNPLAGQRRLAQGRRSGAGRHRQGPARWAPRPQRERDYLEAVAAYYEDFANRPERARQLARAKAYEALAAKYPDDDEAQIFYALYLAGTQTPVGPDLRGLPQGGGDPREAVRQVSRSSRASRTT